MGMPIGSPAPTAPGFFSTLIPVKKRDRACQHKAAMVVPSGVRWLRVCVRRLLLARLAPAVSSHHCRNYVEGPKLANVHAFSRRGGVMLTLRLARSTSRPRWRYAFRRCPALLQSRRSRWLCTGTSAPRPPPIDRAPVDHIPDVTRTEQQHLTRWPYA